MLKFAQLVQLQPTICIKMTCLKKVMLHPSQENLCRSQQLKLSKGCSSCTGRSYASTSAASALLIQAVKRSQGFKVSFCSLLQDSFGMNQIVLCQATLHSHILYCAKHFYNYWYGSVVSAGNLPARCKIPCRQTSVNLEPRKGTCLATLSRARMHSFSASKLLLISAPSSLVCLSLSYVSAA